MAIAKYGPQDFLEFCQELISQRLEHFNHDLRNLQFSLKSLLLLSDDLSEDLSGEHLDEVRQLLNQSLLISHHLQSPVDKFQVDHQLQQLSQIISYKNKAS